MTKSLSRRQRDFTLMVVRLIDWIFSNGMEATLGEAWRTPYQQAKYFLDGKSKTLHSKHLQRLAIDLNLFIDNHYITDPEKYRPLGEYWESINSENVWGGRFGIKKEDYATKVGFDANHFELQS